LIGVAVEKVLEAAKDSSAMVNIIKGVPTKTDVIICTKIALINSVLSLNI
jgi:predicted RNase H-like nuclease (RuvC/YqgF family)